MLFQDLGVRKVVADFSGGRISSDGGALLLRQVDAALGVSRTLAGCFEDGRDARKIEHTLPELCAQRILGLALGYEDLNDHATLRTDPLLAAACGKSDPLGAERVTIFRGAALASAPTLNRLELGHQRPERGAEVAAKYRRIEPVPARLEAALLKMGTRCLDKGAPLVVLDLDATDDPLHGTQEGRFFHGYYGDYCYLPLFCFAGDVCLWAQLRTADRDASDGSVEALEKIVAAVRARLPRARILLRADSGFAREAILAWCEQNGVHYVIGLARNERLNALAEAEREELRLCTQAAGGVWQAGARHFVEFDYQTRESWSRERRVIGRLEWTQGEENPRYVVTDVPAGGLGEREGQPLLSGDARTLYEETYCARGQAENVLKQMKLDLHSDRTSTHDLASNQLRLWWSAFAYLLLERVRAWGLGGSELARATLGSVRLRLLKIGAQVRVSVRRVLVELSSAYPLQELWRQCQQRLAAARAPAG